MQPMIKVVYRGEPPFRAELVDEVERYDFTQPNLRIHFLDGHVEERTEVLMVMSAPRGDSS